MNTCNTGALTVRSKIAKPGAATIYRIGGTLCTKPGSNAQALQLLLHGASYDRSYWDLPFQPARYSYARHARAAGFATLVIDHIGAETSHGASLVAIGALLVVQPWQSA